MRCTSHDCYHEYMLDTIAHRYLKIPYTLHVRYHQRPRSAKQTILFIHGIGSTGDHWKEVIERMPKNVRIISIDLLGFGNSPAPKWAVYSSKTQARAVLATILKLGFRTRLIVVGHSLGALVAIEMTKRYPLLIDRLILCSPPLYTREESRFPNSENLLIRMYNEVQKRPEQFVQLSDFGFRYGLLRGEQYLTNTNVDSYVATLGAAIVDQTSFEDAKKLKVPTLIIRGKLDPLVIGRNFTKLEKANPNIAVKSILAGHDIRGKFVGAVVSALKVNLSIK